MINPKTTVIDPTLLSHLSRSGMHLDRLELVRDYALHGAGLVERSPYAQFYKDSLSNKRFAIFSGLPFVNHKGERCDVGWESDGSSFESKVNLFHVAVVGTKVTIDCINDQHTGSKEGDSVTYNPRLYLSGQEILPKKAVLHATDPTNENYHENVIEWDYGICKRWLRLIEGSVQGTWRFDKAPNGDVLIKYNHVGNLKLSLSNRYAISDDEERIPLSAFGSRMPNEYPLIVSDSKTFYPDAGSGLVTFDASIDCDGTLKQFLTHVADTVGVADSPSATADYYVYFSVHSSGNYNRLYRAYAIFSMVGLSSWANVTAVTESFYGVFKTDGMGCSPDINVYHATPAADNNIANADYNRANFGVAYCDTPITYSGFNVSGYNDFVFNAAGIADVNTAKSGDLKVRTGIRNANYDVAYVNPGGSDSNAAFYGYLTDQGIGYQPKLLVTYHIVGPIGPFPTSRFDVL